jgi:hypothetical protein
MGIGYQFSDRRSFDYDLWYSDDLRMPLRGPQTVFDSSTPFWSFVGAAQTFGRFAARPFPALISSWKHKPHINLGLAGAGPGFFVQSLPLINKINQSELCFLQIMSGRSISTRLLKTIGFGGVLQFTEGSLKGQRFLAADAYRKLIESYGEQAAYEQVHEARASWVDGYKSLIETIKVPIICVWVSGRDRATNPAPDSTRDLLGDFPHLITPNELAIFEQFGLHVVGEKLTQRTEQLLEDFTTRRPVDVYDAKQFAKRPNWSRSFNTYYPTPEMHQAIANDVLLHLASRNDGIGQIARVEGPARQVGRLTQAPRESAPAQGHAGQFQQLFHRWLRKARTRARPLKGLFSRIKNHRFRSP